MCYGGKMQPSYSREYVHEIEMLRECIKRIWSSRSESIVHNAELLHALEHTTVSRELLVAELERCERDKQDIFFFRVYRIYIFIYLSTFKFQRSAIEMDRFKRTISDRRKNNRAEIIQKNR